MNGTKKTIWRIGLVFLSAAALISSPAAARQRGPRKAGAKAAARVTGARGRSSNGPGRARGTMHRPGVRAPKRAIRHVARPPKHRERPTIIIGGRDSKFRLGLDFGLGRGHRCTIHRRWIPGRSVIRTERVLVEAAHYEWRRQRVEIHPGHYEKRHVPPVTETLHDSNGNPHTVVIEPGRTEKTWVPPEYEIRRVKVHVPDRYETREVSVWVPGRWSYDKDCRHGRPRFNLGAIFNF